VAFRWLLRGSGMAYAWGGMVVDTLAMAKLIYSAITSLDGYVEDTTGNFDWAAPDDDVFAFLNDLERPVGTYLYGRRMYETLVYWETAEVLRDESPVAWEWMQLWRAADKLVYSRSLETASSARTRIERSFDPGAVRAMKDSAERDITVGGPDLAAQAFRSGLVDRCQLFLTPVLVGGGKPALPENVRLDLDLVNEHRFENGVVFLDYRVR
jgi:dihydrofolate reductase